MSFFNDLRHTPAATKPPGATTFSAAEVGGANWKIPLMNLSIVQNRMDSLQKFLLDSVNSNTLLDQAKMNIVSSEIESAIQQTIVNGAALLSTSPAFPVYPIPEENDKLKSWVLSETPDPEPGKFLATGKELADAKVEIHIDDDSDEFEIVELDAVELLAEHVHFCEICGKGFKRDANLRMHMRAHGNQFKTLEALAKPEKAVDSSSRRTRFSCPFAGCNRNKQHKKFRPLKSATCVKNHFKRNHCPKMYSCTRCNKKSFSVVSDLKCHLKHCGEIKWKCTCGTSFSRKDKLFGHMALFEGHMPAVLDEGDEGKEKGVAALVEDEEDEEINVKDEEINVKNVEMAMNRGSNNNNNIFEGILDGFDSIDNYWFQDVFNSPNAISNFGSGMDGFFNF